VTVGNLSQNYPNPFNPVTKINYTIPEACFVSIRLYDILGCELDILINEEKIPGYYEIEFDGSNLPSGVYFYRIQTGNFTDIKKLILIK
jgi:hypothetical protein